MKRKGAPFGGAWTNQKLEVIRKYLSAYTTALKNQPFTTVYIDAFAATGYRELKDEERKDQLLFPDLAGEDSQRFLEGSAVIALRTKPRFSKYYFVERRSARYPRRGRGRGRQDRQHGGHREVFPGPTAVRFRWRRPEPSGAPELTKLSTVPSLLRSRERQGGLSRGQDRETHPGGCLGRGSRIPH